ncbi:MAG: ATP-grasp domain-containing protein [Parachlamydiaceae bacterium]
MNPNSKKKVLITFGRSFLTLDLARQWHARGHTVFIADSTRSHVTFFSKAVSKSFVVPSPRFEPEAYITALIDIVNKEKIDIVIPIYEETVHLSKAIDRFPSHCTVFSPHFELYEELQNKWLFQQKLHSLGIPTLKKALVANAADLREHKLAVEYALKPCYSRASQKVHKVDPKKPIPNITIESHNPWIAQEWAYGNRFCTYSICHEGTVHAHSTYPVNYAIEGNSCVTFEATHHQGILDWVSFFVKKINFSGQIAFDFIEKNGQQLYAIECNPRATSGLLLFNEKNALDKAFLKENKEPIFPEEGASQQVFTGMLLYGWRKSAKPNNRLSQFLKSLFTTKDVVFRIKDPKPLLSEPFVFARLWFKSRKLGISLPDCFTFDHDWNNCEEKNQKD